MKQGNIKVCVWSNNIIGKMSTMVLLLFFSSSIQSQQISIIGNATPANDWSTDYDLTESAPGSGIWTTELFLTDNECKFRQDHSWMVNWGGTAFPSGTAVLNSEDNITVDATGLYGISFNVNTLAYSFTLLPPRYVGIGTSNPTSTLDVEGSIRSYYSGSFTFILNTVDSTYNITIPGVPTEMVGETGSLVLASIVEGCEGVVIKAKVTSSTTMEVTITNHCGMQSSTRLNYIIFKL